MSLATSEFLQVIRELVLGGMWIICFLVSAFILLGHNVTNSGLGHTAGFAADSQVI